MKSIPRANVIAAAIVFSCSTMAADFEDRAVVVSVAPWICGVRVLLLAGQSLWDLNLRDRLV